MKVLLLSNDEKDAFLLQRLLDEGQEVRLLVKSPLSKSTWDGILPKAKTPQDAVDWGVDLVLATSPGFGNVVQWFRGQGVAVLGGGTFHDEIESNYDVAMAFVEANECPHCAYMDFDSVTDAFAYTREMGERTWRMVLQDRTTSFYPTTEDLERHLDKLDLEERLPSKFVLTEGSSKQRYTEDHEREFSDFVLGGFVNSRGIMNPCFAMATCTGLGDFGIRTPEGVSLKPLNSRHPLVELTLAQLAPSLFSLGYTGPVFVGCTCTKEDPDGPFPEVYARDEVRVHNINLTPPDGFWAAFMRGLDMPFHFFLDRLMNPRRPHTPFDFYEGVTTSRKISVPPYPLTEAPWLSPQKKLDLLPIIPARKIEHKHPGIMWNGIRALKDGSYKLIHPIVGYLTGKGHSCYQSIQEIATEVQGIRIPYAQVNTNASCHFRIEDLPTWEARVQLEEMTEEEPEEMVNA